jgi:hypothetical protein
MSMSRKRDVGGNGKSALETVREQQEAAVTEAEVEAAAKAQRKAERAERRASRASRKSDPDAPGGWTLLDWDSVDNGKLAAMASKEAQEAQAQTPKLNLPANQDGGADSDASGLDMVGIHTPRAEPGPGNGIPANTSKPSTNGSKTSTPKDDTLKTSNASSASRSRKLLEPTKQPAAQTAPNPPRSINTTTKTAAQPKPRASETAFIHMKAEDLLTPIGGAQDGIGLTPSLEVARSILSGDSAVPAQKVVITIPKPDEERGLNLDVVIGKSLGLRPQRTVFKDGKTRLVSVHAVAPGGWAEKNGVKVNDVFLSLNGKHINELDELGVRQMLKHDRPLEMHFARAFIPLNTPRRTVIDVRKRLSAAPAVAPGSLSLGGSVGGRVGGMGSDMVQSLSLHREAAGGPRVVSSPTGTGNNQDQWSRVQGALSPTVTANANGQPGTNGASGGGSGEAGSGSQPVKTVVQRAMSGTTVRI